MTRRKANSRARELFGRKAFVFTGEEGYPCYVSDGTKVDGWAVMVGFGDTWEEALAVAEAYLVPKETT